MRKRTSILLVLSILLLLGAVRGAFALTREIIYTVRYSCIISPDMRGHIEGEWVTDCAGVTTGWGWAPGSNCTTTDISYGAYCPSGGSGGGPFYPGPNP